MALRSVASLGIVVLVVTAGCFGLFPGPEDPTTTTTPSRTPYDVPESTTGSTERVTPLASPAFRDATGNHTAALRDAGRFVVRERTLIGSESNPHERSFAVDLDAGRYWWNPPPDPAAGVYDEGDLYQNDTGVYERIHRDDGTVRYRQISNVSGQTPRNFSIQLARNTREIGVLFPFVRNGTATFEGEEMARFTATEPSEFGCTAVTTYVEGLQNVTAFLAVALVDDRGIVRKFECRIEGHLYTGDRHSVRVERTISEVGTASVRPPDLAPNETAASPRALH